MELLWYCLVAGSLTTYVVLDGFDLGAGIFHLFGARSEHDRRTVLNAIGPFWDGNEVWLLATGGILYLAFPRVYASAFSGFYLPLMIVLWLLMIRGLGIELRHHVDSPLARQMCDTAFGLSSALLAFVFGVALGNLIRGVPLQSDGYFFVPLWTDLTISTEPGAIDWFTASMGATAFLVLAVHGSIFVAMKASGDLQSAARTIALRMWWGAAVMIAFTGYSVWSLRPEFALRLGGHPAGRLLPAATLAGFFMIHFFLRRRRLGRAFTASVIFIVTALGATAFGLYPNLLTASGNQTLNLTVTNSAAPSSGLLIGLTWWIPGILLATGYFLFLYRAFRGKAKVEPAGY